jgi:23S rRNA (cytidine2498-2'-O)-methyltransferase
MNPRFYYATCQVGAEKAVKANILAEFPHLRFSFSRPGFITFKEESNQKAPILVVSSPFARLWGVSVGQAKDSSALLDLLKKVPAGSTVHAFQRDQAVPGDEPEGYIPNQQISALVESLKQSDLPALQWNGVPSDDASVYDLIWIDDFHLFLGKHYHASGLDPAPGNQPLIQLPKESPSRAYLKIAEAIHRFKPEHQPGMQVLEIGCSPGGATTAMLSLGFRVTGVDPKKMDDRLYSHSKFHFIQKMAIALLPNDLIEVNPEWIVMDMNIAPLEAIDEIFHVVSCLRKNWGRRLNLRSGFLTIKLNDWKFAESIPLYLKRIEECGFRDLIAIQLCSNRQEFLVYAQGFQV